MNQAMAIAGANNTTAMRWLFYALVFELAPLICALVTVARTSASMASELAVMNLHNEYASLRRWGIEPADHLLLPRVAALALGLPALTILFQLAALLSGWLATALLQDLPLIEVFDEVMDAANAALVLVALLKSALLGLLIGVIATHHGSTASRHSRAVSDCGIHAVGNSLVAVFLVTVVFALLVFWAR
jgi:phospholipid/cholesterol/gamma-HCH transport system permease protein